MTFLSDNSNLNGNEGDGILTTATGALLFLLLAITYKIDFLFLKETKESSIVITPDIFFSKDFFVNFLIQHIQELNK